MEAEVKVILKQLSNRLTCFNQNIYLICDGALMPNLDLEFSQLELEAIPLFIGKLGRSIVNAGPWMIVVDELETKLEKALAVAGSHNVGVCWISECYTSEMLRHLRGLNIARLPDGSICYFRHYDPGALAWLAEKLDDEQASRLLGPASGIGFVSGFAAGSIIDRPPSLPAPKAGPITFSHPQLLMLAERDKTNSRERIKDFLRSSFPIECNPLSDRELIEYIALRENKAREYGLHTEEQIALWCHASVKDPKGDEIDRLVADRIRNL